MLSQVEPQVVPQVRAASISEVEASHTAFEASSGRILQTNSLRKFYGLNSITSQCSRGNGAPLVWLSIYHALVVKGHQDIAVMSSVMKH